MDSLRTFRPVARAMALIASVVAGTAQADVIRVRYESELAGTQYSTATFSQMGVETFETAQRGVHALDTDFGGSGWVRGYYDRVDVRKADQYGGSGGTGNYAVAFRNTGYELRLQTEDGLGVDYFGYWLSALDANNIVTFYRGDELLLTFKPEDMLAMVRGNPAYFGNPNPGLLGRNSGEPYAFVNFFNVDGWFDRIVFSQSGGGGYESDNHTVGRWLTEGSGTIVSNYGAAGLGSPFRLNSVPLPGTAMLCGLALLGLGAVARRRPF